MFRRIRWRIAIPYVVLIVAGMAVLAVSLSGFLRRTLISNLEAQLESEALLLADSLAGDLPASDAAVINAEAGRIAGLLNARVTIIAADGTVVGESHDEAAFMTNHLNRPEVQGARAGGRGSSTRYSQTVGYDMLYVAVPVRAGDEIAGYARVALPLREVEAQIGRVQGRIVLATLLAALVAVALAVFIAERIARPIRQVTAVAGQMAEGNLHARLLPASRDEVGELAERFNFMARQLEEKVDALAGERSRLAAVLHGMADGVVIADADGRVELTNPAATRFLGAPAGAAGRSVAEVLRDYRLIQLWQTCGEAGAQQSISLEPAGGRHYLHAIATPLSGAGDCLIILQDLTEVRRSEQVRRDFVSNLSHELRTPLASLKALVETLHDSALDDPPAARHFLNRMEIEVDALTQMVQELLELSRIESGRVPFVLVPADVQEIVAPAAERLRAQADRAGVELEIALPADLPRVSADRDRIAQVVTNLVHNAVKFTPAGGHVTVSASRRDGEIVVSVADTGVGIPSEELARIFERFYKTDRSRAGGGTGLGLAIAKHIVQGHGGRIWAESRPGAGSTFRFTLKAI